MKFKGIDEVLYSQIQALCQKRLKNTVSPYEVMRWLQNFKIKEYTLALTILQFLDVYTEAELVELWDERLKKFFANVNPEANIIFTPVADVGKSGTLMMYYLKKAPTYLLNEPRITIYSNPEQIKFKNKAKLILENSVIVLIDDFSGSGNSVLKHYLHYVKLQVKSIEKKVSVYCLLLFCLEKSIKLLTKNAPELSLVYEEKEKAFSVRGSVFGYPKKMQKVRDFCFRYGSGLWITENKKGNKTDHALGYENSQALIVFPYNPPNNTVPIIWSTKKGWKPLYARSPKYKISEAKRIRKELASYISLLNFTDYGFYFKTGNRDLGWKTEQFVTKTDFHAFAIMFLIRKRRSKPTIRQILGITESDYSEKVEELKSRGLMDPKGEINEVGEEVYLQVRKQIKIEKRNLKYSDKNYEIKNVLYLPKQFRGESLT